MKIKHLLLLGLIVIFSSCSTAYRTGQTPDDVYYSPAPAQDTYVRTDNQNEKDSYANNNSTYNSEDREIRRGIKDSRYRNSVSVDFGYGYDPYGYNSYGYNNPYGYYNSYGYNDVYMNPYYNPYTFNYFPTSYSNYYYSPQVYIVPKSGLVSRTIAPRKYNLGAYTNNTNTSNTTTSIFNHGYRPVNTTTTNSAPIRTITTTSSNRITTTPATRNSGNGVGNFIRRVFTPDNNSNRVYRSESNNTYDNSNSSPARTTQSSSSGSSNSSSSGSSSAPVRTFRK
ncbi:MAG TPA: hypothetical protein VGP55_14820 [Chitinophagaceae bacterium]|nr:hypothetical protein [Chitinophagaceae bacterium]